ncbi:MAG: hypothetical protein ABSG86_14125 [Thermoguttaceae bacterium]
MASRHFVLGTVIAGANLRRLWGVGLAVVLGATWGPQAQAQIRRPQPPQPQPVTAEGTVAAVQGATIQLNTATNQPMVAGITPMTSLRVTGSATVDALQARSGGSHSKLCVEFVADLTEDGKAKGKISRLAIVTVGPGRPAGLLPESEAFKPPPAPMAHSKVGGGGGNVGGGGLAAPVGTKKSRGKQDADLDLGVGPSSSGRVKLPCVCTVRGTVKGFHGGTISVTAGRTNVTAELADNAQIEVDLCDLGPVSRGDKIQIQGMQIPGQGGRPSLVRAESVEITLAQPFSGGRKHSPSKVAKPEKTSSRPGPAKKVEAPEPAEKLEPAETKKPVGGPEGLKSKSDPKDLEY